MLEYKFNYTNTNCVFGPVFIQQFVPQMTSYYMILLLLCGHIKKDSLFAYSVYHAFKISTALIPTYMKYLLRSHGQFVLVIMER